MRYAITLLVAASIGAGSLAMAEPPAATSEAAVPAAPPPASAPAAAPAPAAPAASTTSAPPAAAPGVTTAPSAGATAADPDEISEGAAKRLLADGYKPEMHHGKKVWCRREEETGSHLGGQKICASPADLKRAESANQDFMRDLQRQQMNPVSK